MDPKNLQGLVMILGLAENLLGSDIIPGMKKLFGDHLELTPEQIADLDDGFIRLTESRQKLRARRAEIVAAAKSIVPAILVLVGSLLFAAPAAAQTPTDYTFESHFEATPTSAPISTFDFAKTAALCDQAKVAVTGVTLNPRYIRFDDPANGTRDCVLDTGATSGVLFAMPFGGRYVGVLIGKVVVGGIIQSAAASDPSNPFVRGTPPARVTGVRIGG